MKITVRDIGYEIGIMPGQKRPAILMIDKDKCIKLGYFNDVITANMFVNQLEKMMEILGVPMDREGKDEKRPDKESAD